MDEDGVTPVIGTILLLGIFALTTVAVLLASTPLLDRIQGQGAQQTMVSDLSSAREAMMHVSGPDSQRSVPLRQTSGVLSYGNPQAVIITVNQDTLSNLGCDLQLSGWVDVNGDLDPATNTLSVQTQNCATITASCPGAAGQVCMDAFRVVGGSLQSVAATSTATTLQLTSTTLGSDDWLFRLRTGGSDFRVLSEAWLVQSDRLAWQRSGATSASVDLYLGAIINRSGGGIVSERPWPFTYGDSSAFHVLRVLDLDAVQPGATTQPGTHEARFRVAESTSRTRLDGSSSTAGGTPHDLLATRLRLDFAGDLARAMCLAWDFRDLSFGNGPFQPDPDTPCDGSGIQSVVYDSVAGSASDTFPLEVSYAHIRLTID